MRFVRPSPGSLVAAALLLGVSVAALRFSGPPRPAGDLTPDAAFSTERAMPHVRALAAAPHPMGSAEHARVREDLADRLQGLGFIVERQRTTGLRVRSNIRARGTVVAGLVENLMVRLRGRESTGAVLLACHYDSVPAAPGAADDTAAVAALLETLRALQAGPPLRNDVIALFTDGEEEGLLGAEAFVSRHPWARDVRAVLNFEARGNRGAVQMFETTPGNGAIVSAWADAVPKPAGTSLAYEVYRRLPNDTDFTEFKRLNAVGLGFAFIGNVAAYHTPNDSVEALDRWSLQGVGDAALSLTRRFGEENLDLTRWRDGDRVFFSLPGGWVVHYAVMWAMPFVIAGLALWVWLLVRTRRRGAASVGGVVVASLVLAALSGGLGWGALRVPGWIDALQARTLPVATSATSQAHALGVTCVVLGVWAGVWALLRIKLAAHTLALAGGFVLWLAAAAASWRLPGGSYLLAWPALAALPAALALPQTKGKGGIAPGPAALIAGLAVPTLCLVVPTAVLLFDALLLTPQGCAGLIVLISVVVLALGPVLECVTEGRRWWPAGVLLLLGAGATAAGVITSAHDEGHSRPENVVYALDADTRQAVWATTADPVTPWLEQFVTADPKRGPLAAFSAVAGQTEYVSAPAPLEQLPGPSVVLERQASEDGGRLLGVRVSSPRRARSLSLRMPGREVLDMRVNGREPRTDATRESWAAGRWGLEFANVPPEGVEVVVRVKGNEPVAIVAVDRSEGLPAALVAGKPARPPSSHPVHRGDVTIVQRTVTY